uniref:Remorin C-terminal domain-containing protein n=1 Tax=Oryza punctata TaxID=4537 RepID=A0A0E0MPJ9_ORYPU
MEYERIHKVQMGVMSPTKLRMKLLGSHGGSISKTDDAKKSPRASPARLDADEDDDDHPKNSLLPQELDEDYPKDRSDSSRSRSDASHGRACHGGGNGYDSSGGFEFYREERPPPPPAAAAAAAVGGTFFRQVPSKWNDAEKWLAGRHVVHSNPIFSKKAAAAAVSGRVAPDASSCSPPSVASRKRQQKRPRVSSEPVVAAVSMRDVGTEMTPMASKEQSRSGTPAGAATPSLSPLCSVPSSPRGGASSERELQIRTRREIAALGLQLGKMNIASWASKDDDEEELPRASPEKRPRPRPHSGDGDGEAKKREFEARAVTWQETQKCKLALRFQRKEVKIQEWESCQKAKFEAKMRHAEVQAEQMKARAKQKLSRRLSALSHKAEGKQARVEARRSRQAARLARQVDRIRETGAAPSRLRRCCSWLFL